MKTSCLIVDDEPLAIKVIASYVEKVPDLQVAGTAQNALEAFELLNKENIHLVFLDINMPTLSGLDLVKTLSNPPAIIFTTAHREYAVESYELEALDYLLKPVSFPRFMKAVNKYFATTKKPSESKDTLQVKEIIIRADRKNFIVPLNSILYFEGLKDYVKVYRQNEPTLITKATMSDFEKSLYPRFIRIHKSFLVASDKISAFSNDGIEIGDTELPVGRTYKNKVMGLLDRGHS